MMYKASRDNYINVLPGIEYKTIVYGDNTLMAEFRLEGDSSLPFHNHPHEQTGYLVSGHIKLTIGNNSYNVTPGDAWCIPGNVEHSAEILEDSVAIEVFSPVREDYIPS